MDFLKRHAFVIICGLTALAGIGLAVTGVNAMSRVPQELEKAKGLYNNLNTLTSNAANERLLQAEEQRIEATVSDYEKIASKAESLYGYEPLIPDVFPAGDDQARRQFRRAYGEAMVKLLDQERLRWGGPADAAAIEIMRDRIADERYREQEHGLDPGAPPPSRSRGSARNSAGVLTREGAKEDAAARAHMAAAQRIYMYATPFDALPAERGGKIVPSLDFEPYMVDTGSVEAPYPEDCWRAQVGYWIQQDVIDAIVKTNDEAAEELKDRGEARWVGTMPIKDIISIRVSQSYVTTDEDREIAGAAPGDFEPALPPGTPVTVFTKNAGNDLYDIRHFTVKLIMDQRYISRFVDHLCSNSMHTLLRAAYVHAEPNKTMVGKIYGDGPVVNVVMDFETAMLGSVFRPLMPLEVCEKYGINCPEPAAEEGD